MKTAEPIGPPCPACGAPLVSRTGKLGQFLGCSRFPECRGKAKVKVALPTENDFPRLTGLLQEAMAFTRKAGGVEAAITWIRIVESMAELSKAQEKADATCP